MSREVTRARASNGVVEQRMAEIMARMRAGLWIRGESAPAFAEEWGIAVATVEGYSAEAWRRICAEADDAEQARPTIAGTLAVALEQSAGARNHKATAMLADTWSRVVGARAAERHEHSVIVAQFEALPPAGKASWLRERAARMLAEADRIESSEPG